MRKIIFLIPIYNDWKSLANLLSEINNVIKDMKDFEFSCIIVNDASNTEQTKILRPSNIKSLKIINMKKNRGHARCNAFGLRYINDNEPFDYVIPMDGDGEDRPSEIFDLINKILEEPNFSVVAKRIKRSEGFIFQSMYQIHKLITYIFTGKKINYGNYSCLQKKDVNNLSDKASLWSSFSGSVEKYIPKFNKINSIRGTRYFGTSKMSLMNLFLHSLSIIAVFKYQVILRSTFMIIILAYLDIYLSNISIFFQILIILFNLIIFIVSLREKENHLKNSHINVDTIKKIIH